jgi:hypothetical protein
LNASSMIRDRGADGLTHHGWCWRPRTSLIRHACAGDAPIVHRRHRPGTLHHTYVLTGMVGIGPVGEQVSVSRGDFIRFRGVSHTRRRCCRTRPSCTW